MTFSPTQRVVFQPATGARLQRGIHTVVAAVRPTLGPHARPVALQRATRADTPEILDDAGLIARRIIELPDRDEDMGAMLVRHMLWRVRERVGDGAATAAVIFESVFDQGLTYITAGGNAMRLRRALESGLQAILAHLAGVAEPVRGRQRLESFAYSVCSDTELAHLLGEVFDIIGEYGRLDIRGGQGRGLEREYVEGMYWDSEPFSREFLTDGAGLRAELEAPAILVTDLEIQRAADLEPLLTAAWQAGERQVLLLAQSLAPEVVGLLVTNQRAGRIRVVAAKTPYVGGRQRAALEDLALLTGAQALWQAAGDTMAQARHTSLGHARRAWADRNYFGIIGGRGDPKALRRHLADLRAAAAAATAAETRQELRERIGKLMAGSATVWIGGATEPEVKLRTALAERTAEAIRGALLEGVVPGGGVTLLGCSAAMRRAAAATSDQEQAVAHQILANALEAPTRTIIANAGADVAEVMGELRRAGPGYGFDAHSGRVVPMVAAGILDAASVVRQAAIAAVTTAALALTTGVLIHHARPSKELDT